MAYFLPCSKSHHKFLCTLKFRADAVTDKAASGLKFEAGYVDGVVCLSSMHIACNSMHFVRAGAVPTTSKKQK